MTLFSPIAIAAPLFVSALGDAAEKPNVLFISIDDLNDWIGVMGVQPDIMTPNIDKLSEKGFLFTRAHFQFPVCGPSKTSVFAGYRPDTLDILNNDTKTADENFRDMAAEMGNHLLHEYFVD